jgi:hypothetical protein
MAYGLKIINDASEILVDSDYVNPTFIQKLEFTTTPTYTEAGVSGLHTGYIRRDYTTIQPNIPIGKYIILWTLPDNGTKDVWYFFPVSRADQTEYFTCQVYANSDGTALTYNLPTAYLFAVDYNALSAVSSTGPALRLYDSSGNKTFDSTFPQLIPYDIKDSFTVPGYGEAPTSIALTTPTNAIYLLPRVQIVMSTDIDSTQRQQTAFDTMYRRASSTVYAKTLSTYTKLVAGSNNTDYGNPNLIFASGNLSNLSVLVADADLYQATSAGSGGGANPSYSLSSSYANVNESPTTPFTFRITLNTTLVANGTLVPYTVTGISAADLSSETLTGNFTVQSNTAYKDFTVAADGLTEGAETFLLTLNGFTNSVSVVIADTSRAAYAFGAPTINPTGEGVESFINFNALYNDATYPVTFAIAAPTSGTAATNNNDVVLSWSIPSGANYTQVRIATIADLVTEGTEAFRVSATVNGSTYYSSDITITDTTYSSITAANSWTEITDNTVSISVSGVSVSTVYMTSSNTAVIDVKSGSASSWSVNSTSFTASTIYQAKSVTADTSVTLYLKDQSNDKIIAQKTITVTDAVATYTLTPAASSVNEGSSLTFTVGGTNIPNGTYYWSLSNAGDFVTNASSFTITNNSGSFSVTPTADTTTEGAETFYAIILDSGLNTLKTSSLVTINDTSLTPTPTYSFTRSVASVNEGGSFTITFNTNQSGNFAYTITGVSSADLEGASLTNTISNGQSHLFAVSNDVSYAEGTEIFTIALNNGQASTTVTINDTSFIAPTYSFTSQQNVTETQTGNSIATFTFTNVVSKTVTFAIVAPTSGAAATSGTDVTINIASMSIDGSSFKEVSYYPAADQITEGAEYFRITATIDGSVVATTSNISITDSSTYPASGTLLSQSCAAYGVYPYTLNKVYANGNGGTYTEGTYNSPTCGYVPPPTYTLTASAGSVNEGSSITFTISGTNIVNGSYYWTVSGSGGANDASISDLTPNTGYVTITDNSGSFSVTAVADSITETAETFVANLWSQSGSAFLTASSTVTINASGTPVSSTPVWTFKTTPGTYSWTIPTGRTVATFMIIAGGGGGRSTTSGGGGGGAGGQELLFEYSVTPGDVITMVVGAGGAANTAGSSSSISSSTGASLTITGGTSGTSGTTSNGGAAGSGSFTSSKAGGSGVFNNAGGGGGGAGGLAGGSAGGGATGNIGGAGAASVTINVNGTDYESSGGGGGAGAGEGGTGGTSNLSGGAGAGPGGTGTNNGGAGAGFGGGGGGAKAGGIAGAGSRGLIGYYG